MKKTLLALCLSLSLTACSNLQTITTGTNNNKNFGTGENITKRHIDIEYEDVVITDNDYFTFVLKQVTAIPGTYDYTGRIIGEIYDKGNNSCITYGYVLNEGDMSESKGDLNSPNKYTSYTLLCNEYINYQILYDEMDSDEISLPLSIYFYKSSTASGTGFKGDYIIHLREDNPVELISEEYVEASENN